MAASSRVPHARMNVRAATYADHVIPARSPHAWVILDSLREYPALVLGWEKKFTDANGYHWWQADCIVWDGDKLHRTKVPSEKVKSAAG